MQSVQVVELKSDDGDKDCLDAGEVSLAAIAQTLQDVRQEVLKEKQLVAQLDTSS